MSTDERSKLFEAWADERFQERQGDAIYILICRQARSYWVTLGEHAKQKAFPDADLKDLTNLFNDRFAKSDFDAGLRARCVQLKLKLADTKTVGSDGVQVQVYERAE